MIQAMASTIPTKKNPSYELTINIAKQAKARENGNNAKRALNGSDYHDSNTYYNCTFCGYLYPIIICRVQDSAKISTETAMPLHEVLRPQCSVCQNNIEILTNISKISIKLTRPYSTGVILSPGRWTLP
jgi:hypothetical protein